MFCCIFVAPYDEKKNWRWKRTSKFMIHDFQKCALQHCKLTTDNKPKLKMTNIVTWTMINNDRLTIKEDPDTIERIFKLQIEV